MKSQIMMLSLLLLASLFLIITPLCSSSLKPTYLYYFVIINILIITLGADAGLFSALSQQPLLEDTNNPQEASTEAGVNAGASPPMEKSSAPEKKIPEPVKVWNKVKKCPSTPSLFFIGNGETEPAADDDDQAFGGDEKKLYDYEEDEGEEEEEEVEMISGKELFTKAEMFIGNFYKQLKMQREESWNRIHGFYQKAF